MIMTSFEWMVLRNCASENHDGRGFVNICKHRTPACSSGIDVADVLADALRLREDERYDDITVRVDIGLLEAVVGLCRIDNEARDGADAARIELGQCLHREDKHPLELVQEARDVRLHVRRFCVEPRQRRWIGM